MTLRLLFVCTGNICRSPSAEGVARKHLADGGLDRLVEVDSAGIGGWHVGDPPDSRAIRCARRRGYDLTPQRARQLRAADYGDFHLILGMDSGHESHLSGQRPPDARAEVRLFLDFLPPTDPQAGQDVPDPYYGGPADYEHSLDLIERGMPGLIAALRRDYL
jgi:protein-tyrosine phosphatase